MTDRIPPSVKAFFPNSKPVWPQSSLRTPLVNLNQLSIVVHDVEAAIEYFGAAFGWGPFYLAEASRRVQYRERISEVSLRLAFTLVGDLEIELLQPISGHSPHMDHLQRRGEGLLHIRFATEDIEGTLTHLAAQGIQPTLIYTHGNELLNVYVDSDKDFGVRIELIQTNAALAKMNIGATYTGNATTEVCG